MKITIATLREKVGAIALLIDHGTQAWLRAGKLLVELIDKSETTLSEIASANSRLSIQSLQLLERVGRGKLHPNLLADYSTAARRLSYLPLKEQERCVTGYIPVASFVNEKTGSVKTVQKRLAELTPKEANMVFDIELGEVRKPSDQINVLRAQSRLKTVRDCQRYSIQDGKITFFQGCTFTASELEELLKRVKAESLANLPSAIAGNRLKKSEAQ